MVHGWMDVGASYQFVVDALSQDRWVIAPDWRGYGQTRWGHTDNYWIADYLADLDFLLDHYSPQQPVDLVGRQLRRCRQVGRCRHRPVGEQLVVQIDRRSGGRGRRAPDLAPRIRERAYVLKTMPLMNKTQITDAERARPPHAEEGDDGRVQPEQRDARVQALAAMAEAPRLEVDGHRAHDHGDGVVQSAERAVCRGAELLNFCRARLQAVEDQVKLLDDGALKPWSAT